MILNDHSDLRGKHSFLSPSKSAWERYDQDKLLQVYIASYSAEVGTAVHEFASKCIEEKIKLKRSDKNMLLYHMSLSNIPRIVYDLDYIYPTVMAYVNDCIGFRMKTEVIFKYSDFCFGTADAFLFSEKNSFLRIHDLKTGKKPASIEQLIKYASLFCLEYKVKPETINTELRIYQSNQAAIYIPESEEISEMMSTIIQDSDILEKFVLKGSK